MPRTLFASVRVWVLRCPSARHIAFWQGKIKPVRGVTARLLRERDSTSHAPAPVDLAKDRRGLRIAKDDMATVFARAVERDFNDLAARYYLNLCGDPKIRVSRERITVTFDLCQRGIVPLPSPLGTIQLLQLKRTFKCRSFFMDCLKVSSKSSPASVAGAIAGMVKDGVPVNIQCVGAGAVNQAIKAVAIARGFDSIRF